KITMEPTTIGHRPSHANGGFYRLFEIVRVERPALVFIAGGYAIVAGAKLGQGQPPIAGGRFCFLGRKWFLNRHLEMVAIDLPAKLAVEPACQLVPLAREQHHT